MFNPRNFINQLVLCFLLLRSFSNGQNPYQSYQTSIYCNASSPIEYPTSIEEVQALVNMAILTNQTVKAIGSRHSISDVICTEGIPMSLGNISNIVLNPDGTVKVGAGAKVKDVLDYLQSHNLSLIHVPAFGGITVGGAIGTGAHGSSLLHPTSLSDQVVSVTIVDGQGNVQIINSAIDLAGFQVHLGLLGIVVDVTLTTVPLFKMTIRNTLHPDTILTDGTALIWAQSRDWFEMWWFPSSSSVVVSIGDYVDVSTPGEHYTQMLPNVNLLEVIAGRTAYELLQATRNTSGLLAMEEATRLSMYEVPGAKPPLYTGDGVKLENPATGFAHQLMSNRCESCPWDYGAVALNPEESSLAFGLTDLPRVVNTVKGILGQEGAENTLFTMIGMFIRFSRASPALMAISSGRPTVTFEWTTPMRTDPFNTPKAGIAGFQAIAQAMVTEHSGRPHWGKNGPYFFNPDILEQVHPNRDAFIALMTKYDPNGVFHNKFAKRILATSAEMNVHPSVTHCALQEYCICSKDDDCGNNQICKALNGYMTCNDAPANSTKDINLTIL